MSWLSTKYSNAKARAKVIGLAIYRAAKGPSQR